MRLHQSNNGRWDNKQPLPNRTEPEVTAPLVTAQQLVSNADHKGSGSIIGNRYVLQNHIGKGRLGERYEAVDQQLTQAGRSDFRVSIELFTLHKNQSHENSRQGNTRFASEFVDLLALSHPNVARIIDYGIDGTTNFITTELLEGASLRAILDSASNDACTKNEVLAVVGGVAEALRFTHGKGLVHGDLSAESIFVTNDFDVKIADFAAVVLARTLGSVTEKQAGSSQSRKSSADVFGLASIAYELLANERPYGRASRHEARVRGIELRRIKHIPRYQWKALARALALQPKKRTPSVGEFAAEFGVDGTESLATAEPVRRPSYQRLLWPLLAVVAVAGAMAFFQLKETAVSQGFSDREVFSDSEKFPAVQNRIDLPPAATPASREPTPDSPQVESDQSAASTLTSAQENLQIDTVVAEQSIVEQNSPARGKENEGKENEAKESEGQEIQGQEVTRPEILAIDDADQTRDLISAVSGLQSEVAEPIQESASGTGERTLLADESATVPVQADAETISIHAPATAEGARQSVATASVATASVAPR